MHPLMAIVLFIVFVCVVGAIVKWLFSSPSNTSEDWVEDQGSSFNTPYPLVMGSGLSTFEGAVLGAATAAIIVEEVEKLERSQTQEVYDTPSDMVSDGDQVSEEE